MNYFMSILFRWPVLLFLWSCMSRPRVYYLWLPVAMQVVADINGRRVCTCMHAHEALSQQHLDQLSERIFNDVSHIEPSVPIPHRSTINISKVWAYFISQRFHSMNCSRHWMNSISKQQNSIANNQPAANIYWIRVSTTEKTSYLVGITSLLV